MERWGYRPSSAETEFSRHLKAGRVFTADERADFWNFSLLEIYHMYLYLDSAPCYLVYCLPKGQDLSMHLLVAMDLLQEAACAIAVN